MLRSEASELNMILIRFMFAFRQCVVDDRTWSILTWIKSSNTAIVSPPVPQWSLLPVPFVQYVLVPLIARCRSIDGDYVSMYWYHILSGFDIRMSYELIAISVGIGTIDTSSHSFSMYWYPILSIAIISVRYFSWLSVSLTRCAFFTVLALFKNLHFDIFLRPWPVRQYAM